MVHVKKCPYGKRGRPSTEFYKDGEPQIYCEGWIDNMYDELIAECANCPDHVSNAQNDMEARQNMGVYIKGMKMPSQQ